MKNLLKPIETEMLTRHKVKLFMLCLNEMETIPTGNKYFKLKYNIKFAKENGYKGILTFGGAYSNHILATAKATKQHDLQSIGIIRGEQPTVLSPTLQDAQILGMQLVFMSRTAYRQKNSPQFLQSLAQKYDNYFIVPEGGTNSLAIKGTAEIVDLLDNFSFDFLCTSIGTAGTIAGLYTSKKLPNSKTILGFSALKGNFIIKNVEKLLNKAFFELNNIAIFTNYHCGGYAKTPQYLIDFIIDFHQKHQIILDPIYTSKMMIGIYDLVEKGYFPPNANIVAIHSGGLQGLRGNKHLSTFF